ncbi:tannase/feruloyl esterase family alpha/beta hydrolase [Comamonas thiooxydans]|uniref:tannase/feruloyl esterase family alpha/beta hydrolase n=1 Tax=Comamonas thiooxydans TaxID=363952 RepID=UPI000A2D6F2F|nr:tannase/feruloyl esterase family alpha/beta hydrolase [Comamonas thiooxydans]BDR09184.1 tannase/feruloyl esterase family alpha/beta hydrolase [Comamonas thiooxydans]
MKPIHVAVASAMVVVAGCGDGSDDRGASQDTTGPALANVEQKLACSSLRGAFIPAALIGLPTKGANVSDAVDTNDVDSGGQSRTYCLVTGTILPVDSAAQPIRFQVNLPKSWNQRVLQFGGGGLNGSVVTGTGSSSGELPSTPTPLARGYATLGSDSGHDAASNANASFALNQEQLLNFGQHSIKKTIDVAKYLVDKMYAQKPKYTYFNGGSQGGHEAVQAAQRYPDDYDGVIAQYPVFNVVHMWSGQNATGKAIHSAGLGVPSPSWLSPSKVATLFNAVFAACDGLDGVTDGIVSNISACNSAFNINTIKTTMRCAGGADTGNTCFSDAQITAIEKISSPVTFDFAYAGGWTTFPKWNILEGANWNASWFGASDTVTMDSTTFALNGASTPMGLSTATVRGIMTQNLALDPFTFNPSDYKARIQQVSGWLDDVSLDYSRFAAKGGKMLMNHGTVDNSITGVTNVENWNRLVAANGQAEMDRFARFYYIPGYGHGSGQFSARAGWLAALEEWVEKGTAPQRIIATDGNSAAATAATNGRTRPLCAYPSYPRYTGPANANQAQANDAANFTCTQP